MSDGEEEFVDEIEGEDEGEGPAAIKKLREKLKKAVEEKQEYLEGWQRARADFANYKREEAGIHGGREEQTKADFIENLLPTLDAFEMALKHKPTDELQIVHKQLIDSLKKIGIEQFGVVGEVFDHNTHEALGQIESGEKVVEVMRSGYSIGNKIIRPAQVII
ncbi:MAG: nucleotide exchange factor GrpE [bacterium]|nr:nucleotide exchange factor GrpE [bacterium]